jgi:2,4-dienoyl-CoA reductase-like NADH-dependent reductase (Old Yellow Enzyme family)
MTTLLDPMSFPRGRGMKNRFMLAPLTNSQSHEDGVLSDEEYHWLTMRAQGGFGLTMTCAAHVQAIGKGFPGQLGVFGDEHLDGLTRLAAGINAEDSVSIVQLHHAGMRSPAELIGEQPVCPSADEETGARALDHAEVLQLIDDFVAAAVRSERAGFDGVEIHGAHGYIVAQFLSPEINQRDDEFGGSRDNRARLLFAIIDGIREQCGPDFILGVRLSPERFGLRLAEMIEVAERLLTDQKIDFLDMSLWDVFKEPEEAEFAGRTLMSCFTELDRGDVRLGVAGKIRTPEDAERALAAGVDWVMLGRAAILHHDFPDRYEADPRFVPVENPVTRQYLADEGLSEAFIDYMSGWRGFVTDEA